MGKRGVPSWEPTDPERRMVEHYVSIGYTREQIAALMDKHVQTLVLHCRRELDLGKIKVNAQIGGKLFQKAMSGDTASLIFWAKTQMGWRETVHNVHSGPDGGPIQTEQVQNELDTLARLLAAGTSGGTADERDGGTVQ
jgi:hypothetical protein